MAATPCPCGRGAYAACCQPLHQGTPAPDAESLMRSRYSAYALGLADYLLATWHATTRPATLGFDDVPALRWLGLDVRRHAADGDTAVVEFIARHRQGGGRAGRLHETSRFVREQNQWFYLDGQVTD